MTTNINIEDYWKNHVDVTGVVQFYIEDIPDHDEIKESFSYIYDTETDEVEFSFNMTPGSVSFPVYYTSNGREFRMERNVNSKFIVATVGVSDNDETSTVIIRIPAYGKLIRELYEENKSPAGLISPGDYNPTLGSNFYKDSNDNSYVTKDTFEDYVRSSNTEGHLLDEVGRSQLNKDEGYYKIIRSLRIKCNALEKTVDSEGNYYSADRDTNSYLVYGIYTYDLYDSEKNLLIEGVSEVTSHVTIVNASKESDIYVGIGKLIVPDEGDFKSYNYTYVGHLYYEDFDGIIQTVQSDNHITLERFVSVEFGIEDGTPKYYEGGYPLYIIGPYVGNSIKFSIQVRGTVNDEEQVIYPEGDSIIPSFSNPQYNQYFRFVEEECSYNSTTGKIKLKVEATSDNNEDDPFRPSYAKILPSLERTTLKIYNRGQVVESLEASYYIIQKSSKIGIIPKKYDSRDSTVPIDMPRRDGKYILTVTGGIGIKTAFLGITSEVDPYDRNIVRSWTIRENMDFNNVYSEDEETNKVLERQYFFENYSGNLQDKIVFITGAYDGTLSEFYIRDYIDRSDVWRRAMYESEVTIIPEIDNTDRTVDLGGNWTYTLDTSTNYFIGSDLLYLFNENNRYYTQRFNLDFTFPPNSGPSSGNFKASIDDFGVTGPGTRREEEPYTSEEGITYTYYSSPRSIFLKLFGDADTYQDLKDRNKEGKWEKIEIKRDSLEYISLQRLYSDDENSPVQMYIPTSLEPTDCPIKDNLGQIVAYLKLTTTDTGYPAFDTDNGNYIRYTTEEESPLFFMLTTTNTGCAVKNKSGLPVTDENDQPLFLDLTTSSTGYPAYKVIYEGYVDKYQSLVSIKYSRDKQIYFAYEGMENKDRKEGDSETKKTVKFDILYPQEARINTKDILRIPTINPLKFVFKLSGTTASYEVQEIRFYCGIEGIQPLELLSESSEKIPDPETEYADYPEVELTRESNKYEVICQTSNDLYPDWRVTSANNTFNYSAPKGNTIEFYDEETSLNFDESKSYLQIDLKNNLGGSDIIDFTRVKNGAVTTNWWNDWRFFIYNKFINRFNVACSSGSPELEIKDGNNNTLRDMTLDRIGLYRIHISTTSLGEDYDNESKTLAINIPTGIELYRVEGLKFHNDIADRLEKGHISRGEKFPNSQYVQIDTNSSGVQQSSFVLYLWYEGSNVKIDKAKMYFLLSVGSGEKAKTLSKYITINQTNSSNLKDSQNFSGNLGQFFNLTAYKFDGSGNEVEITGLPRQPIDSFCLGFPIFNGRPGRIVLTNDNPTFPYKLKYGINGESTEFIKVSTKLEIDSPLTSADYNNSLQLEESNCYIKRSFISYSYDIRPDSYGIGYREEGATIANQSTKSWRLSFMDARNNNNSGDLYYYSPIDLKKFELKSPSAKYGKNIMGRDSNDNFRANEGYIQDSDTQDDNFLSDGNKNTAFYSYETISSCSVTLYHPNLQNDRLSIVKEGQPLNILFVDKALNDSGVEVSADSISSSVLNNSLFLRSNGVDFEALSWSRSGKTSLNITLYTDASDGGNNYTNIPLELLSIFGSSLGDAAKSVGWITTMVMSINFEVTPPAKMDEEFEGLFSTLVINSDDPSYPGESQYFGIGQEFVNKIKYNTNEIQPYSTNGKNLNPQFIIPLSWFRGNEPTISIQVDSGNPTSNARSLVFGAELYKKEIVGGTITLGDEIPITLFNCSDNTITIKFSGPISTDIVLVPKFTNIEYDCHQGIDMESYNTGEIELLGIDTSALEYNSNIISGVIKEVNSPKFIGYKLKGNVNRVLELDGRLCSPGLETSSSGDFSTSIKRMLSGYSVTFSFNIHGQQESIPLIRRGYGHFIFVQPGCMYVKSYTAANNNQTDARIIWYSYRRANNTAEQGVVQPDSDGGTTWREAFVLLPRYVTDETIRIGLHRGASNNLNASTDPNIGSFFIQELTVPIFELGYSSQGFTYGGKQRNAEITIKDIGSDQNLNSILNPPSANSTEYYRYVSRRGYTYNPFSGNTNNSGSNISGATGPEDLIDGGDDSTVHSSAIIYGPYPSKNFSGNDVHIVEISNNNGHIIHKLIFKD